MYQTAGFAIIAFITANFTATLAGHTGGQNTQFVFFLTAFYMIMVFALNFLAPKLPIRLNNLTVILRLIPIILMGTLGLGLALLNGGAYAYAPEQAVVPTAGSASFYGAVFATVFAYNGWQAAVAFNSEVKNSKKNFPIALLFGFLLVVVIYVLYFMGVATAGDSAALMANNQLGTRAAFANVFGEAAGNIIMIFVIISGLGILNMCCMGMSRGLYSLARRGMGPIPERMVVLDEKTDVPVCSMVTCVAVSFLWLMVIFGNHNGWFGMLDGRAFMFDLPNFYNMIFFVLLIPLFVGFIAKNRKAADFHVGNRVIAPVLAIGGCGFMIFALVRSSPVHALVYLGVAVVLALMGFIFIGGENAKA